MLSISEYISVRKNIGSNLLQIFTNERPSRYQQAETPRDTITVLSTGILKICKDEFGSASGRQIDQRDQKDEEETNIKDKDHSLNMRKYSDAKNIDQNGNQKYYSVKYCSMLL